MDQTYRRNLAISLGGVAGPVLRRGARGDEVVEIQLFLANRGYDVGPVDGKFGRKTEDAVRQFQMESGAVVDGRVGDETRAAMERVSEPAPLPEMRPKEPVEEVASSDMPPDNGGVEEGAPSPDFSDEMFTQAAPNLPQHYGEAERSDGLASVIDAGRSALTGVPQEKLNAYRRILQPDEWAARPGDGQDELRAALLRSIMNRQGVPVAGGF